MAIPGRFERAIDLITSATTIDTLPVTLASLRDLYGLVQLVYCAVRIPGCPAAVSRQLAYVTCDPERQQQRCGREGPDVDRTFVNARIAAEPFDWTDLSEFGPACGILFSDEGHVRRHGLTIPIRGCGGERALLSFASSANDDEWPDLKRHLGHELLAVAYHFHNRSVQLAGFRPVPEKATLSRRELDCVARLARGIQPKNVALELGITESTVRLYIQSARRKLRCATTAQMIARLVEDETIVL